MAMMVKCGACGMVCRMPEAAEGEVQTCPNCGRALGGAPQPRTSRMAVASLVLGVFILPCLIATGLPALILGTVALVAINGSRGALKGRGYAIAGLCLGALSVVLSLVIIPMVPAIAIPNLRGYRIAGNESAAVGSLRTLATQQGVFAARVEVDQDGDGKGEYGYLCELCGEVTPRNKTAKGPVTPVCISQAFSTRGSSGNGVAEKSGYCFRLYLTSKNGKATDDAACDGNATRPSAMLDPKTDQAAVDAQETHFVIYAWPVDIHDTGQQAFAITETGVVYGTRMLTTTYSGANGPSIEAAFSAKGDGSDGWFNDSIASGEGDPGNDGNIWQTAGY